METIDMYKEVFKDCVECYLDGMEEEDKVKLSEKDIKDIAYKLIFESEYMWETINETIDYLIGKKLIERKRD